MVTKPRPLLGLFLAASLVLASCGGAPRPTGEPAATPTADSHARTTRQLRACVAVCRRDHALESEARDECERRCLHIEKESDDQAKPDAGGIPWGILLAITAGAALSVLTELF